MLAFNLGSMVGRTVPTPGMTGELEPASEGIGGRIANAVTVDYGVVAARPSAY